MMRKLVTVFAMCIGLVGEDQQSGPVISLLQGLFFTAAHLRPG